MTDLKIGMLCLLHESEMSYESPFLKIMVIGQLYHVKNEYQNFNYKKWTYGVIGKDYRELLHM